MNDDRVWFVAVIAAALGALFGGLVTYRASTIQQVAAPQPIVDTNAIVSRIDLLEQRVAAAEKLHCFNVKTDKLDVAIFATDNLKTERTQ